MSFPEDRPAKGASEHEFHSIRASDMRAYVTYLGLCEQLGRDPGLEECLQVVQCYSRFSHVTKIVPDGQMQGNQGAISRKSVRRIVRRMLSRVTEHLGDTERLQQRRGRIIDLAHGLAQQLVAIDGAYDDNPKLFKEKVKACTDLLRVCGASLEEKGGGAKVTVNNHLGAALPPEVQEELEALRQENYQLKQRNRLAADSLN